jgi:hypothetical protein
VTLVPIRLLLEEFERRDAIFRPGVELMRGHGSDNARIRMWLALPSSGVRAIAYDAFAVWRIAMASAIRRSSSCVVAAIAVASLAVHTGRAQTWTSPRTPWGDPDFKASGTTPR